MVANPAALAVGIIYPIVINTGQPCTNVDRLDIFNKHWSGCILQVIYMAN